MPPAGLGLPSAGFSPSTVPIKCCLSVHKYNLQPLLRCVDATFHATGEVFVDPSILVTSLQLPPLHMRFTEPIESGQSNYPIAVLDDPQAGWGPYETICNLSSVSRGLNIEIQSCKETSNVLY